MPARAQDPSPRPRVSAIVTTFNEEANIAGCIESLLWCDEILVVDSFSTDRTPEIVRGFEKVRFYQRTYYGSASQKNWAMDQVTNEWILIFDADERCTPALHKEIQGLLASGPTFEAYTIKRRVYFLDRVIRFSGWQHDRVVRLIRNGSARYPNRRVHADMVTKGPAPVLKSSMDHYMADSLDEYVRRIEKYSFWGAAQNWTREAQVRLHPDLRPLHLALPPHLHLPARHPRRHARPGLLHAPGLRHLPQVGPPLGLARQRRPRPRPQPPHLRRQRGDLARAGGGEGGGDGA